MIETFTINPPSKRKGVRRPMKMRRKSRRRKYRRNSWFGQSRRHSKASKKGWWGRRGKRAKKSLGRKWRALVKRHGILKAAPKWRGLKRRGLVNNPLSAYTYYNPMRRHGRRSHRKSYRRNAYVTPGTVYYNNPIGAMTGTVKTAVSKQFLMGTVLPVTGGIVSAELLGAGAAKLLKITAYSGPTKAGLTMGAGVVGSVAIGMITKNKDLAAKVLAGGAICSVMELYRTYAEGSIRKMTKLDGLRGFGQELTEELKSKIASSIKSEIEKAERGVSAFVTKEEVPSSPMGAFVVKEEVPHAGVSSVRLDDYMTPEL